MCGGWGVALGVSVMAARAKYDRIKGANLQVWGWMKVWGRRAGRGPGDAHPGCKGGVSHFCVLWQV